MITAIILTFFIGTLTGYIVAALMAVSSNTDRAREEQETEQPPVFKIEEKKLKPIVIKMRIPRNELERVEICHRGTYIGHKIMREVEKELQHYVIEERDPLYMEYVYMVRFWVDTET